MAAQHPEGPSPRRVEAGRANRRQRGPLSVEGRERLRLAALRHQPWRHATGPQSVAGKAQAAANGKKRQQGPRSLREIRAELAELRAWLRELSESRRQAGK